MASRFVQVTFAIFIFSCLEVTKGSVSTSALSISTRSLGEFRNHDLVWSADVPNITFQFRISPLNSGPPGRRSDTINLVMGGARTSLHIALNLTGSNCAVPTQGKTSTSSSLLEAYSVSCGYNSNIFFSTLYVTLTIFKPKTGLNGTNVTFQFSRLGQIDETVTSPVLRIEGCPSVFEDQELINSATDDPSNVNYNYGNNAKVKCARGLMFHGVCSNFTSIALAPVFKTCGPYTAWEGPNVACWQGQVVNVTSHHEGVHEIKNLPTVFACYNPNQDLISKVTLKVSHHKEIEHKRIAWGNFTLPWTPSNITFARCVHHYFDAGNTTEYKRRLHVFSHTLQTSRHNVATNVRVGKPAHIRIPFSVFPPITRDHVHVVKNGVRYNNFLLRTTHKKVIQFIELDFTVVMNSDLGNYSIVITSVNNYVIHINLLLTEHGQPSSLIPGVVSGTVVFVCLVAAIGLFFLCRKMKKGNLRRSSPFSSTEHMTGGMAESSFNHQLDDVFHNEQKDSEHGLGTSGLTGPSATTQLHVTKPSTGSFQDGADATDENGYLKPSDIGIGLNPNYINVDSRSDNGSVVTEASYMNATSTEHLYVNEADSD